MLDPMEITYKTMAQSSFSPHHPSGFIPDVIIDAMVEEIPQHIKETIEAAFILPLLKDSVKIADLHIIMTLVSLQRLMAQDHGTNDWTGMIQSYEMPSHYSKIT